MGDGVPMVGRPTTKAGIQTIIEGGTVQGFVGATNVQIENAYFGRARVGQPPQQIKKDAVPPCPYPGLAHFGPDDSALFFGRDAAIMQLEASACSR
jgi:hypothetical protein